LGAWLLGTGDAKTAEVEGSLRGLGGAREDCEGLIGGDGRDDGVARQCGQIGQEALEAVNGEAVGGAFGSAFGEGGGRALRLGDCTFA
jgi:hypothetical protein